MAATGLVTTIPTAVTDTTLPIVRDDGLLTTGSLLLVDPIHSANTLTAVPANNGTVPNLAWREAAATIGGTLTQTDLAAVLQLGSSYVPNTDGKIELSGKGGLHGIVSVTTQSASQHGFDLVAPAAVNTYLFNNPTHEIFMSQEIYVTRVNPSSSANIARIGDPTGAPRTLGNFVNGGSQLGGQVANEVTGRERYPGTLNSAGVQLRTGSFNAWASALPSSAANVRAGIATWGRRDSANTSANVYPSFILYRSYLEDLTVSGRSWATVDALVLARHTADVLTAGGKYFGDTYTAPSTIA